MKLNSVQQAVIDYDGNALVFASAGTGKTNTVALKISDIIAKGKAKPNEILCLTFTNKGCNEIAERVLQKVGDDAKEITIKTFHSYCYSLIKEKQLFDKCGLTDYSIFDEEDSKLVIKKVVEDMQLRVPFLKKEFDLYHLISLVKKSAIQQRILSDDILDSCNSVIDKFYGSEKSHFNLIVKKLIYKFNDDLTSLYSISQLKDFIGRYQEELKVSHAYDFDDLEYYANFAIQDDIFLDLLKKKYKYVFIDEAQDTSFDEYNFVKQFIKQAKVILCGDFFQTIYEWRGSKPNEIIEDYRQVFKAQTFVFNINYRSTKNIADSSFGLLKNMFPQLVGETYKEDIVSENVAEGEPVYLKYCYNAVDEAEFINEQVKINAETNACVLVRTNDYAIRLSKNVDADKFFLVQDFQYYKRNEVKEIIAFLKLILNPYDTVSMERIAVKYVKGFGEARLKKLTSDRVYNLGIRIADLLDIKTHTGNGDQYNLLNEKLAIGNVVVFDTETTGLDIEQDEIIQIAAIRINQNGDVTDKLNIFVKNQKPVGSSYYIHKISDEKLAAEGIDKKEALIMLLNFIGDSLVVGHNVTFDLNMLNAELEKCGMASKHFDYYDTYLIADKFIVDQPNHKLETLSKNLQLNHESSHDALDDVKATAYLLVYLEKEYLKTTRDARKQLLAPYLNLFRTMAEALEKFRDEIYEVPFESFLNNVIDALNLRKIYEKSSNAIFNIEHFIKIGRLIGFRTSNAYNSLRNMVNIASLSASDFDAIYKEQHLIPIITVHQSKGCEFNDVYIAGLGTDIFPSYVSRINNTIEEEKRLFYVAYTRAKKRLYLLAPKTNTFGYKVNPSIFLSYIPSKYIKQLDDFSSPQPYYCEPSNNDGTTGIEQEPYNTETASLSEDDVEAALDEAIDYLSRGDYDSAIDVLSDFEFDDDADVLYFLGRAHFERNYDSADIGNAESYFKEAFDAGREDALIPLGFLYEQLKEYEKAFECYKKGAELKLVNCYNNLGCSYMNGRGTKQNARLAFIYFQKAANEGISEGQFNLGCSYEYGRGTPVNKEKAFYWYTKAAKQDNVDAIFNIGMMYYNGDYVVQDFGKAIEQFKKVFEIQSDDAEACYYIGLAYYYKDEYDNAIQWLKKAFGLGNTFSLLAMGIIYQEIGNYAEARNWFFRAKNAGIKEANKYLGGGKQDDF